MAASRKWIDIDIENQWTNRGWKQRADGTWADPDNRGPYLLNHETGEMRQDFAPTRAGEPRHGSTTAVSDQIVYGKPAPAAIATRADAPALDTDTMRQLIASRMALDLIADVSKDHMGLGILYDELPGIGDEPSADLANLLASQSGLDIVTHVKEVVLVDLEVDGVTRKAWKAHVLARDRYGREADAVVFEPAEQTVAWVKGEKFTRKDGKEVDIARLNEPKSAITKARRNAQIKVLGYPKTILVPLIQKVMKEHGAGRSR